MEAALAQVHFWGLPQIRRAGFIRVGRGGHEFDRAVCLIGVVPVAAATHRNNENTPRRRRTYSSRDYHVTNMFCAYVACFLRLLIVALRRAEQNENCPQSSGRNAKSFFLCDSSCSLWTVLLRRSV